MSYSLKAIRYLVRVAMLGLSPNHARTTGRLHIGRALRSSGIAYCFLMCDALASFQNRDVRILLQNENGPCPLLAASNCLLLRGSVTLPADAIRNGVASLEDMSNMIANHALQSHSATSYQDAQTQFYLNELLHYIPKFQFGMDINPILTAGCLGFELTAELNALVDMLGCKLVHGWLIDPIEDGPVAAAAGSKSYNELLDRTIASKDAEEQLSKLQIEIEQLLFDHPQLLEERDSVRYLLDDAPDADAEGDVHRKLAISLKLQKDLQEAATASHLIEHFLTESSHQLTTFGLEQLHKTLLEGELAVMFRNNHYGTITKHEDQLFLLVTDLGYANTPAIVWEKLDVIDGDTEFCNSQFTHNGGGAIVQSGCALTPNQLMAESSKNGADYRLAVQLSMQVNGKGAPSSQPVSDQEGRLIAAAAEVSSPNFSIPAEKAGAIAVFPSPSDEHIELGIPIHSPVKYPPRTSSSERLSQEAADRMLALQLQEHHGGSRTAATDDASFMLAQQLQQREDLHAAAAVNSSTLQLQSRRQNAPTSSAQTCSMM